MSTRHEKHQIIFARRRFAQNETKSTQGLSTSCFTRYSYTLVEILTVWYRSYLPKKFAGAYVSQTDLLNL